jgi:diketogulonate reductase-like aldo/keto reductase
VLNTLRPQVLEGMYKSGKARSIGVSNYNTAHVQELVAAAEVKPMVNQVRTCTCTCARRAFADVFATRQQKCHRHATPSTVNIVPDETLDSVTCQCW